ncbi:trichohyalin isoform X2 [Episyrphus balteatus]|uniref:trichohyalin isoform X2 n=1 Tax=Episyrphus balteatus TaxID=286459 RepID=UPI0024863CF8|nr:trichohyalin isoform X2 [Episyrphus balteatus]
MAATIQTQPTQQQPALLNTNNNNNNKSTNPQLKRIVYSKYRELLGSYNDKANAIIDSLPAYMVKEDRGFHFDPQIIDAVDNVVYGTPPAPPPLSAGSLPSQRLSTQIPQYNVAEAPACVQNAMMTKDKKPFTYTPGGIDLSQIKSQRMAKRLARNAQSEGTTGQQQMHRPTQLPSQQQHQSNGGTAPAAAQLGATAMGMPFQVLPTGPPPPPPQPGKVGAPPPPPPAPAAPQNKLAPQSNGSAPRRSPTPQNFEPPPMGFRPEIKIPPNPMASLKKVPPPQEKNNFWMEEYRKERSKSPMVGNDENDNNYRSSPPNNPKPETNQYSYNNNNNNQQQNDYQQPQQNQYRAPQSPQAMRQQQQEFYNQNQPSPPRTPVQQKRIESPYQTQQYSQQQQSPTIQRQTSQYAPPPSPQYQQQQQQNSPQQSPTIQRQQSQSQQQYQNSPQHSPQIQRQQSIPTQPQQQYHQNSPQQQSPSIQRQQTVPQSQYQSPTSPQYQQQQKQQTSPTQQQSVPWRQQKQVPLGIQNNVSRPRDVMSPAPAESPRPQLQQQQYPSYLRSREALSPAPEQQQQQSPQLSQPYQQKNAQVGSIYIPPVVNQQQQQYSPYQDSQGSRQQPLQQQQQTPRQAPTNRWMNAQGQPVENQTLSRIKSPPPPPTSSTPVSSNGFAGSHNNAGLRLQINTNTSSSNGKERIIPIQLEQTPTPTRTPSAAPGFGPQPFYNSAQQQQYSSVPSPPMNQGTPNNGQNSPNYVIRSPNQFVDQGYNQYTGVQDHPSRVTSPPMQQQQQQQSRIIQQTSTSGGIKTRIIPIAVESEPDGPLNPNNARGPISQQPIVIQNDPRNQNTWGNGGGSATPTQSKSFRILQKITDTSDDSALENKAIDSDGGSVSGSQEHEPQLQRPSFARQMTSTGQINSPNNVEQMKRMQLNNEQQVYANRARNQEDDKDKNLEKSANGEEDPRYRGPSNPSKTFKKLQGAVERCSPSRTDQNGTPPVMKQPQPNRYVSQRPVYSPDEHSQQYVHPSEQQVPEPKIYTGSAIPSRSFKILQAMTTPENAAESDGSDVVESDTSISECPCQQQQQPPPPSYPYPYPYLPPCCAHTPPPPPTQAQQQQPPSTSSSGGDVNNWQYPTPYHPHPHPHHHHHHPHHHPYAQHHPHHQHHPHPHQHPAYPYPPPCPCYYYNFPPNGYDSQNCSSRSSLSSRSSYSRGRSQSQDLPNIIITPSTDDVPQEIQNGGKEMPRNQREGSVIDILSQKLSEISKPGSDKDLNKTQGNDKKYNGDKDKELKSSSSTVKSENENDKVSSEDSSDDLMSSSSDPTSSSSEECIEERSNDGLQAIRSVSNIQFYNNKKIRAESEDDDRTIAGDESMVFDEEEEEEIIGEELEYDEEEVLIEEIDSEEGEEEEEEEEVYEEDDIIIMDDLSVIYEENEADLISPRPSSRISSSVSETSTLANDECEEEAAAEEISIKKEDDEEDNSNSVTVRLPLKFSFSRSSNDENIATVEVGNSQIEDRGRSFSIASVDVEPETADYETDSQDCDVSVTISLSRSSESVDKKFLSPSPISHIAAEVIKEEAKEEEANNVIESEDEDVSVSFSLPMRNKFMDQTWSGDLTNNISMIEEKTSEDNNGKEEEDKETAVETWRKNNSIFEESDEKKSIEKTSSSTSEDKNKQDEDNSNKSSIENQNEDEDEEEDDEEEEDEADSKSEEELDFWATLQATRKEAQMFLEKTAGYWGKSVDGKEKPEPSSNEISNQKDEEKDEDFWTNIRVKKEEPQEKKETKPKLKKKKKIIKKVKVKEPEPEPEPEIKLTIIKPPNANNKSKVVESAIQMIQEKTKKPKKLVKQVSKEEVKATKTVLENEIVQITKVVEEEKKIIEEAKIRRASLCKAKSIDEPKIEEVVVEEKNEEEDKKSKYVREKAELKTQILNQKFAKAFVIPNKPPLMKGVLSEVQCEEQITKTLIINEVKKSEASISNRTEELVKAKVAVSNEASISSNVTKIEERKNSIPMLLVSHDMEENSANTNVIEEPKKLVKKKITKTKTVEEESDGNSLKPPTKKIVKKSTKEPKKIKKKKEDTNLETEKNEEPKETEDKNIVSKKSSLEIEKEKTKIKEEDKIEKKTESSTIVEGKPVKTEETEEPDFWAEIEYSKSKDNLRKMQEEEKPMATDPWANVKTPKESEEPVSKTKETDFWAEIDETVTAKNLPKLKSLDKEPDFWADIDLVKSKTEQTTKSQTLVESSKVKTQQKVLAEQLQTLEWFNIESFVAKHVQNTEIQTPIVMNGYCNYWEEKIEKPVMKKEDSQETDFWLEIESNKVKKELKTDESSVTKIKSIEIQELKPKKKLKKSISATETETEIESTKSKTKKKSSISKDDESSKKSDSDLPLKIKKKTSIPMEDSTDVKPKTKKKISTPDEESTKLDIEASLKIKTKKKSKTSEDIDNGEKRSSIKSKTKRKPSVTSEDETTLWASSKSKSSSKTCNLQVYSDYDIELIHADPEPIFYPIHSEPETGISFWATVSYAEEEILEEKEIDIWADREAEGNSEIDTGKIDFWVTQRKFQANSNFVKDKTPSKINRQTEENDFWAETKNSNFVEDRTPVVIEEPAEEIDFWAKPERKCEETNYFVVDRMPLKNEEPAEETNFWPKPQRRFEDYTQQENIEEQTENQDFWSKTRKFESKSNFIEDQTTQMIEQPTEEVDFWAEIKGPDATNEEPSQIDECELKRNNYKKAMAFFTNTVNVEKKKEPRKFVPLTDEEPPSWSWRASEEPEWQVPEQRQTNKEEEVLLIVEDNETTEDEPETLVENHHYTIEDTRSYNHHQHEQQQNEEEESQSSESISDSTPNHFQIEHLYPKPEPEPFKPKEKSNESVSNQASEESKISVKDRIFAFETGTVDPPASSSSTKAAKTTSLSVDNTSPNLSRNSSQRSESEIEEDDSGVTDMNKPLSETDTESESFPELRKMSPYQRASTHSRLFKLLQDDEDVIEEEREPGDTETLEAEFNFKPRKKIIHNVSITRKQNPKALQEAETVSQRRQRLSLPLRKNQSIDADNPSSPNSPASPIHGQQSQPISDKLVNELIQSLLLKKSSSTLKNLPMEKLQAAAKRVLEEELDSLDNTSLDSTPALTPQEFKNESYADYYDTWNSSKIDSDSSATNGSFEILPSKAFKVLQETAGSVKRKPWSVRCPRVLSSKTVNRDLARVTESPEIVSRCSRSPEMFSSDRASSVGRWKKV